MREREKCINRNKTALIVFFLKEICPLKQKVLYNNHLLIRNKNSLKPNFYPSNPNLMQPTENMKLGKQFIETKKLKDNDNVELR